MDPFPGSLFFETVFRRNAHAVFFTGCGSGDTGRPVDGDKYDHIVQFLIYCRFFQADHSDIRMAENVGVGADRYILDLGQE